MPTSFAVSTAAEAYLDKHNSVLEEAVAQAMAKLVEERAENPVARLGELLQAAVATVRPQDARVVHEHAQRVRAAPLVDPREELNDLILLADVGLHRNRMAA